MKGKYFRGNYFDEILARTYYQLWVHTSKWFLVFDFFNIVNGKSIARSVKPQQLSMSKSGKF